MRAIRVILYVLILGALLFVPLQRIEIANLEPIQAVWMYMENGKVILETDTEDRGSGATVESALADMKQKSPGVVYLDTAQYLFVTKDAEHKISAAQPYVKDSIFLCVWDGQGSIKDAVKYADAHKIGLKLREWDEGSNMPELPPVKQEK